jgi:uncharacterized protein (UPF0333 family)
MKKSFILIFIIGFSFFVFSGSFACTIFIGTTHNLVLVGNNEDFIDPNTYVWFLKAEYGKFGRAYFGYNTVLPQGGMNEKGLFFDLTTVPQRIGRFYNKKEVYNGSLMELALETCANVEDVINLYEKYDRSYMSYSALFADKNGNSVIIETDTIIIKKGNYQIATNFCQSQHELNPYSFDRYNTADSMLKAENNYSIDYFTKILDYTHQDVDSPTQYSNLYDLIKGEIYVYLFHNYKKFCKLNLNGELKKGNHSYRISELVEGSLDYKNYLNQYHSTDYKIISEENLNLKRYCGEYERDDFSPVKYMVSQEFGKLYITISGLNKYQVYPLSENSFLMKELNFTFTFEPKEDFSKDKISASLYGLVNYSATRIK